MRKFSVSILVLSLLFVLSSCDIFFSQKNNDKAEGTLSISFKSYAENYISKNNRTIAPSTGGKTYADVEEWNFIITDKNGDYEKTITCRTSEGLTFTLPLDGVYDIEARGNISGTLNSFTYVGNLTDVQFQNGQTSVTETLYVGLAKSEGTGSLSYVITLPDSLQNTIIDNFELEFIRLDKTTEAIRVTKDNSTFEKSNGSLHFDADSSVLTSGYYRIKLYYSDLDNTFQLVLDDDLLEIADGLITHGSSATHIFTKRTYYATSGTSMGNGLSQGYRINFTSLMNLLKEQQNDWDSVEIYLEETDDISDYEIEGIDDLTRSLNVYIGNILVYGGDEYIKDFYVAQIGDDSANGASSIDNAVLSISKVANAVSRGGYKNRDVTINVWGEILTPATEWSTFKNVKTLTIAGDKNEQNNSISSGNNPDDYGLEFQSISTVSLKNIAIEKIKVGEGCTININGTLNETIKITADSGCFTQTNPVVTVADEDEIPYEILKYLELTNSGYGISYSGFITEKINITTENNSTYTADKIPSGAIISFDKSVSYLDVRTFLKNKAAGKKLIVDMSSYSPDDETQNSIWYYNSARILILPKTFSGSATGEPFGTAEDLRYIYIDEANKYYCTEEGILYNKDKTKLLRYPPSKEGATFTIPETVKTLGGYVFCYTKNLEEITNLKNITIITNYECFECSGIKSLEFGEGLTSIPYYTFRGSKIENIVFPSTLTSIGLNSFKDCSNLKTIEFKSSTPPTISIGNSLVEFYNCTSLTAIYVPKDAVANYTPDPDNPNVTTPWFDPEINGFYDRLSTLVKPKSAVPTSGTYEISTAADLIQISNMSNDVDNPETFENVTIRMTADIDISNLDTDTWIPIAVNDENIPNSSIREFKGIFDGNGHILTIKKRNTESLDRAGLIMQNNGTVQNLIVNCKSNLEEDSYTNPGAIGFNYGLIAGNNDTNGIIRNCVTKGDLGLKTVWSFAGIARENKGLIENCVNEANFTIANAVDWAGLYTSVAGIAANNLDTGIIRNCVNYGKINCAALYAGVGKITDEEIADYRTLLEDTMDPEMDPEMKEKQIEEMLADFISGHSETLNGRIGAIVVENTGTITNCYWKNGCLSYNATAYVGNEENPPNSVGFVETNIDGTTYSSEVRGTVTGCGYFETTTVTAGTALECGTAQTLIYTAETELVNLLNEYVIENTNSGSKLWGTVNGIVTIEFN